MEKISMHPGASWKLVLLLSVCGFAGCKSSDGSRSFHPPWQSSAKAVGQSEEKSGPSEVELLLNGDPAREDRKAALVSYFDQRREESEFQAALAFWNDGQLEQCAGALERLLARNPEHRSAALLLSEMRIASGDVVAALDILEKLALSHPHDAEVHHGLGLAYEALDDFDSASRAFEVAYRLEPDNDVYRTSLKVTSGRLPL